MTTFVNDTSDVPPDRRCVWCINDKGGHHWLDIYRCTSWEITVCLLEALFVLKTLRQRRASFGHSQRGKQKRFLLLSVTQANLKQLVASRCCRNCSGSFIGEVWEPFHREGGVVVKCQTCGLWLGRGRWNVNSNRLDFFFFFFPPPFFFRHYFLYILANIILLFCFPSLPPWD